jgi:hypothetical protein
MTRLDCCRFLLPILLLAPGIAHAQAIPTAPADPTAPAVDLQRERVEQQLQELLRSRQDLSAMQQSMQKQIADFDARIAALEAELGVTPPKDQIIRIEPSDQIARIVPPPPVAEEDSGPASQGEEGPFKTGTGLVLAEGKNAGLALGVNGYVRYLNQGGLKKDYTDSFGRIFKIDKRQDAQLNRLQLQFRGWLFDERFRYTFYAWTQNVSQGDPAQVVVGGNINYTFADWA